MDYKKIESCVKKAKSGDDEATVLILDEFRPLVFKISKQFNIKGNDLYDLVQTCFVALIKAIGKYRIGSNTFPKYATTSIKNALKCLARDNKKHNVVGSLNNKITDDTNSEFIDTLSSNDNIEDTFILTNDRVIIRSILATLSPEDFELIFLVFYNGISLKTYAEKKGLNYLSAVRKKDKILLSIKEEYEKKENSQADC